MEKMGTPNSAVAVKELLEYIGHIPDIIAAEEGEVSRLHTTVQIEELSVLRAIMQVVKPQLKYVTVPSHHGLSGHLTHTAILVEPIEHKDGLCITRTGTFLRYQQKEDKHWPISGEGALSHFGLEAILNGLAKAFNDRLTAIATCQANLEARLTKLQELSQILKKA